MRTRRSDREDLHVDARRVHRLDPASPVSGSRAGTSPRSFREQALVSHSRRLGPQGLIDSLGRPVLLDGDDPHRTPLAHHFLSETQHARSTAVESNS